MVTNATPTPKRSRRADDAAPDRGCEYSPKCATCPFSRCIKELDPTSRGEFITAWRTVLTFVAPPDGAIAP